MTILFIDIETVPEFETYQKLPLDGQVAYEKKYRARIPFDFETIDHAYKDAGLHAEFGKIICIGVGTVSVDPVDMHTTADTDGNLITCKCLVGDEKDILIKFAAGLAKKQPDALCAHNGRQFDYPFLARRYMIHGLPIPAILMTEGKKPWEMTALLDTMEMWRFGDNKTYVSLITLAYIFKIPSPKEDLDGSKVAEAFYQGRIVDIQAYCARDIATLINIYRSMKYLPVINKVA
ncbi:MAG: ribonuclease H-like domain-containing protein [Chryseolinea sp.]